MSDGNKGFGSRVVGEEAAARAIEQAKGGGEVFGKRVRDDIPEPSTLDLAKKNSEFGARVIGGASEQNQKGQHGSVSVEDIDNILEENPTFFDNLYEGELARADGPRKAALEIFAVRENGIKGEGRPSVLAEINRLLGKNAATNKVRADNFRAHSQLIEDQRVRGEENAQLQDADRVKALREREDNLDVLKKSSRKGTQSQIVSADTETQLRQIGEQKGLDVDGTKAAKDAGKQDPSGTRGSHADFGDNEVKPESSSKAPRPSQKRRKAKKRKSAAKKTATAAK